jgi:phage terminase small subunit
MAKKGTKLTVFQRRFIKEFIANGGNATKAAEAVGTHKTENAAASSASAMLNNPAVQSKIKEIHDKLGITDEMLGKVLKDGLKANVTKFATDKGIITDERDCNDHPTRLKALEIAHKLRGEFAPDKMEHTGNVILVMDEQDKKL